MWGRLQPFTHWQRFDADSHTDIKQLDLGVNYIIDGYNAQLSATYTNTKVSSPGVASTDNDKFVVALQLQF